jgi:hypothetical protein
MSLMGGLILIIACLIVSQFHCINVKKWRVQRWGGDSNPYKFAGCAAASFSAGERMTALPPHHAIRSFRT